MRRPRCGRPAADRRRRVSRRRARWLVVLAAALAAALGATTGCSTTGLSLPADAVPADAASARATSAATAALAGSASPAPTENRARCADGRPVRASVPVLAPMPVAGGPMPAGSAMARIRSRGYLRVGITVDDPPFGSMNWRTLQLAGFDVDLADAVAVAIFGTAANTVHFQAITIDERPDALRGREPADDIVAATYTITCDRKEDREKPVRFSGVYYESRVGLLVRRNAGFATIEDLAGHTVCTSAGSTTYYKLKALPPPAPRVVTQETASACLVDLQRGAVDAVATDEGILAGMAAQDPLVTVVPGAFDRVLSAEPSILDEPYGIATPVSYGNQFVAFVLGRKLPEVAPERPRTREEPARHGPALAGVTRRPAGQELIRRTVIQVQAPTKMRSPCRTGTGWPFGSGARSSFSRVPLREPRSTS
jgi:polar amino acid transport system substrate-binding protein